MTLNGYWRHGCNARLCPTLNGWAEVVVQKIGSRRFRNFLQIYLVYQVLLPERSRPRIAETPVNSRIILVWPSGDRNFHFVAIHDFPR